MNIFIYLLVFVLLYKLWPTSTSRQRFVFYIEVKIWFVSLTWKKIKIKIIILKATLWRVLYFRSTCCMILILIFMSSWLQHFFPQLFPKIFIIENGSIFISKWVSQVWMLWNVKHLCEASFFVRKYKTIGTDIKIHAWLANKRRIVFLYFIFREKCYVHREKCYVHRKQHKMA